VTVSVSSLYPDAPPIAAPLSWRDQVADMLARVKREARTELHSGHPGSRHRLSYLLALGANLSAQLAELDARGGLA
jgi:hypothetical protein